MSEAKKSTALTEVKAGGPDIPTAPVIGTNPAAGVSLATMQRLIGKPLKYRGGSVPMLKFRNEGDCHLVRFIGKSQPEQGKADDWELLNFEVLDPESYTPEDPRSADVIYKAQLVNSWTLEKYYAKAQVGDVAVISYHGTTPTKRGLAPVKLFMIHGA